MKRIKAVSPTTHFKWHGPGVDGSEINELIDCTEIVEVGDLCADAAIASRNFVLVKDDDTQWRLPVEGQELEPFGA